MGLCSHLAHMHHSSVGRISKETKSRFLSWISRKSAQAVKWATPSLNLELNRFRMECSIEVGFNMDCLTFKFTKPAKVRALAPRRTRPNLSAVPLSDLSQSPRLMVLTLQVDWDIEFGVSPFGRVDFEFPDWFEDSMIPKAIEFAIASLVGVRFRIPMRFADQLAGEALSSPLCACQQCARVPFLTSHLCKDARMRGLLAP